MFDPLSSVFQAGDTNQTNLPNKQRDTYGYATSFTTQGTNAVAIGANAGSNNQGSGAIAIGKSAGTSNQHSNTIIINASGTDLSSVDASRTYIAP